VRNTLKNSLAKPTFGQVPGAASLSSRISNWRTPVAAAALALTLGFPALDAHALALGRVNVLSAIGEPLRAEIEVPDINADEAASLKASIANGDAFRAAGLEYNAALNGAQISLQRRANGSAYLRLTSDKPVNEPFVDLILETSWATGRVVRDYTLLFDPPNLRAQSAPSVTTAPSIGATKPISSPAPRSSAAASPRAPAPARTPRPVAAAPAPAAAASDAKLGSVTVKAGNTATQLAARYKPEGVSLDQMLVAMLNTNPDAFVEGNVNRLKKGAVIDLPATTAAATNVPQEQARQTITAQSKDFNDFRRRLAQGATAAAPTASRKDSGSVQASVKDAKPTAAAPDKLTLSKPSSAASAAGSAAKATKEDAIAKDKQAKDTAARTAELSKNIQDLNKFSTPTVAAPSATSSSAVAAAKPAITASGITLPSVPVALNTPATSTTAPVSTTTAVATATVAATTATLPAISATVASTSPTATVTAVITPTEAVSAPKPVIKPKVPAPAPAPEPSFMASLLDNPFTLPAAGGLLALLAGFGVYRMRQRKNSGQVDSSFLESRLQPDSFFGASGGQRIDTNDAAGAVTGSSMVYSPSQLDAAGDVDPVAEADVYLAYGRDLQAEEILKEAMRTTPTRVAIHAKLMEIYAKRRDVKAFETVANEAYAVTHGQGTEWDAAAALGRELDPSNPLYQGNAAKGAAANSSSGAMLATGAAGAVGAAASKGAFAHSTAPQALQAVDTKDDVDFDLDLDFSSSDDLAEAPHLADVSHTITSPVHVQSTSAMMAQPAVEPPVDLTFDAPSLASSSGLNLSKPDMASFDKGLNFTTPTVASTASLSTAPMAINTASPASSMNALEFDLGDMSLDLPGKAPTMADAELSGDPLDTKLALAQEFREIGDNDGARALAQEVAMEASGALKARAQRMVADLS
jgi:pilus assembly protein FimV